MEFEKWNVQIKDTINNKWHFACTFDKVEINKSQPWIITTAISFNYIEMNRIFIRQIDAKKGFSQGHYFLVGGDFIAYFVNGHWAVSMSLKYIEYSVRYKRKVNRFDHDHCPLSIPWEFSTFYHIDNQDRDCEMCDLDELLYVVCFTNGCLLIYHSLRKLVGNKIKRHRILQSIICLRWQWVNKMKNTNQMNATRSKKHY